MRALQHEKDASTGCESLKSDFIRACGENLRYTIIASCMDDRFASGLEAIVLLNNSDCLTNVASGSPRAVDIMFCAPDPLSEALASLARTMEIIDEGSRETERLARIHVHRYPWTAAELFPEESEGVA